MFSGLLFSFLAAMWITLVLALMAVVGVAWIVGDVLLQRGGIKDGGMRAALSSAFVAFPVFFGLIILAAHLVQSYA